MPKPINRRSVLLGLGSLMTPVVAAATPSSYVEALQAFAEAHPDDLATLEAFLDPEAAADILQVPDDHVLRTTAADREAIADGRLVMYNKPRRANQAIDRLEIGLPTDGNFSASQMEAVSYFFRDMRNDEEWEIDPEQISMLGQVVQILGVPLRGTSLYRSPSTQAHLIEESRRRNNGESKVAVNSLHSNRNGVVKASDLQCELGVTALWRAVSHVCGSRQQGGHSRYSNFVHMDSGRFRSWG